MTYQPVTRGCLYPTLDAILCIQIAWEFTTSETISNCFIKAFLNDFSEMTVYNRSVMTASEVDNHVADVINELITEDVEDDDDDNYPYMENMEEINNAFATLLNFSKNMM